MSAFTAQFPDLVDPYPKEIFFREYDQQEELFSKFFNVRKSTKAYEDAVKVSGLGALTLKPEGTPMNYDDPVQGNRKRVVHSTYGLGFRITMEMRDDDQFDIMSKMPSELAHSTRDHRENLAWNVINNGGSGTSGLDDLSLFSTAHTYLKSQGTSSSSTQSNDLSPAVALSVAGMESIRTLALTLRDESGRFTPIQGKLKWLLVPPALEHEANRILQSQYEPFTSDNQINTMATSLTGMQKMVVQYLSSSTVWYIATDKGSHSLQFFERMEPTTDSGRDFQTKDSMYDVCWRGSVIHRDWRGIWRSNA